MAATLEGQLISWGTNLLQSREAGVVRTEQQQQQQQEADRQASVTGALGLGQVASALPTRVPGLLDGEQIVAVDAGLNHTVVVGRSAVYSCGSNRFAQLGRPGDELTLGLVSNASSLITSMKVAAVACGDQHSVIVTEGGLVFAWGSNLRGQLGVGPQVAKQQTPAQVPRVLARRVACGAFHTLIR